MSVKIEDWTPELVLEALEEAVAEKGEDYKYEFPEDADGECVYSTHDGAPSCIVGYVVKRLDPELFERLHTAEWEEVDEGERDTPYVFGWWMYTEGQDLDERPAHKALIAAQNKQDGGHTWGEALERAKEVLNG